MAIFKRSEGADNNKSGVTVKVGRRGPIFLGMAGLILFFGLGGAWVATAKIAGAVVTTGSVGIEGRSKMVQHLDGGVVRAILVSNGDVVKQGDTVIQLDDELLNANLNIHQNRLREAVATKNRLVAERDEDLKITTDINFLKNLGISKDDNVVRAQAKLFRARLRTRIGQKTQIKERIDQSRNEISGIEAQEQALREQLNLMKEQITGTVKLRDQGIVSGTTVRNLERQRADLLGRLGEAVASKAQAENAINEAEIQILQSEREFRQNVLTELSQVELQIRDLTQQYLSTKTQIERTDIKAPISGMIHELSVFTVGGVIGQAAPIMQIVPQSGEFSIEIMIEPQHVDNVFLGQTAGVRFSSFDQRTTPEINGTIHSISPTTTTNPEGNFSFYSAKVKVTREEMERLGEIQLIPGMPVEVFVKTDDRTVLTYALKPLIDHINRSLREN
ncbi:MAG: HlyD family type I secretion periplasmic adaptor subunit [Lentilitoribacter sp.]